MRDFRCCCRYVTARKDKFKAHIGKATPCRAACSYKCWCGAFSTDDKQTMVEHYVGCTVGRTGRGRPRKRDASQGSSH